MPIVSPSPLGPPDDILTLFLPPEQLLVQCFCIFLWGPQLVMKLLHGLIHSGLYTIFQHFKPCFEVLHSSFPYQSSFTHHPVTPEKTALLCMLNKPHDHDSNKCTTVTPLFLLKSVIISRAFAHVFSDCLMGFNHPVLH